MNKKILLGLLLLAFFIPNISYESQRLSPNGDNATGSWTTTPLFSKVNDSPDVGGTGTLISSINNPASPINDLKFNLNDTSTSGLAYKAILKIKALINGASTKIYTLTLQWEYSNGTIIGSTTTPTLTTTNTEYQTTITPSHGNFGSGIINGSVIHLLPSTSGSGTNRKIEIDALSVDLSYIFNSVKSDSLSISDSMSTKLIAKRTISDSITIQDYVSTSANKNISLQESLQLTDSISKTSHKNTSLSEQLQFNDFISNTSIRNKSILENLILQDTISISTHKSISLQEQLQLNDLTIKKLSTNSNLIDGINMQDSISVSIHRIVNLQESLTLIDTLSKTSNMSVGLNENLSIGDLIARSSHKSLDLIEILDISESKSSSTERSILLSDGVNIDDSSETSSTRILNLQEQLILNDVLFTNIHINKSINDDLSINDLVSTSLHKSTSLFESLELSDSLYTNRDILKTLSDDIILDDSISTSNTNSINLFESLQVSDSVSILRDRIIKLDESLSMNDLISKSIIHTIILQDSLSIIDSFNAPRNYIINLVDSINLSNIVDTSIISGGNSLIVSLIESLGINDNVITNTQTNINSIKNISDQLSISDNIQFTVTRGNNTNPNTTNPSLSDDLTISDTISIQVNNQTVINSPPPVVVIETPKVSDSPRPSLMTPSFGGVGNQKYTDGLKIDGNTYDIGKFSIEIPTLQYKTGQSFAMIVKIQPFDGPDGWNFVGIYMNYANPNMDIYQLDTSVQYSKDSGIKLIDPHNHISKATFETRKEGKYLYVTFTIIPDRPMDTSNMIISFWDNHNRVNNVHLLHAIQFINDTKTKG